MGDATICPNPTSEAAQARIFNNVAAMLREVFTYARAHLGFKTAVGTEAPRPAFFTDIDTSAESAESTYEAVFRRVEKAYPIDYWWQWLPRRRDDGGPRAGVDLPQPRWQRHVVEHLDAGEAGRQLDTDQPAAVAREPSASRRVVPHCVQQQPLCEPWHHLSTPSHSHSHHDEARCTAQRIHPGLLC
jgi:hypothetical protein